MAAIDQIIGFETGNLTAELGGATVVGSVAIESTIVRTGNKSLKLTPASGANGYWAPLNNILAGNGAVTFRLRVTSLPGTARAILGDPAAASHAWVRLNSDGSLSLMSTASGLAIGTTTTKLTDSSRWYRIEVISVSSGVFSLSVEGSQEVAPGDGTVAGVAMTFGAKDTVAATYTAYIDDIAYGNGPIGRGKALLLLPVSDNARAGFTAGAGGTTNLWDAVNNIPPAGTTSAAETNATQIKDGVSSTTDNYDANINDPTTAGVPAWATVKAAQAITRVGTENTAGGAKSGGLKIVSNPTQAAEDAFTYDQSLAVAAESSTTWGTIRGTPQQSPTITLGTKPVVRVGKRTASTRVVDVDLLGLYIFYDDTITQTVQAPIEASQKLAVAGSATPFESSKKLTQTAAAPLSALKKLAQTVAAPFESTVSLSSAVTQTAVVVIEAVQKLAKSATNHLEAKLALTRQAYIPVESAKKLTQTVAGPLSALQPVSRQANNPAETAQAVTKAALADPVEATQKRAQTMAAPAEAGKAVTAALADPVEAAKRIAATEPTTVEALSVVEAAAAAAPAEAGEAVAGTATADVDAAQALAVAAASPAETTAAVVVTGDASPLETLTTAAATADAPLSALQRLQQTAAAPLEALGPVLTSISQTATVVVDALERLTLRATAPLEPGSRISRTVALWIDGRRRRRRSEAVLTGKDGMISADSSSNEADTSAGGIS